MLQLIKRNGRKHKSTVSHWAATLLACCSMLSLALADGVEHVLNSSPPPPGVVFEIVEGDEEALRDIIPKVVDAIARIRKKFPETDFAVVSHGREEFALQSKFRETHADIHRGVLALVEDDVSVHVCETHASWYEVTAEDFPEYVDVAPTGPGQIQLYQELDYFLIRID